MVPRWGALRGLGIGCRAELGVAERGEGLLLPSRRQALTDLCPDEASRRMKANAGCRGQIVVVCRRNGVTQSPAGEWERCTVILWKAANKLLGFVDIDRD